MAHCSWGSLAARRSSMCGWSRQIATQRWQQVLRSPEFRQPASLDRLAAGRRRGTVGARMLSVSTQDAVRGAAWFEDDDYEPNHTYSVFEVTADVEQKLAEIDFDLTTPEARAACLATLRARASERSKLPWEYWEEAAKRLLPEVQKACSAKVAAEVLSIWALVRRNQKAAREAHTREDSHPAWYPHGFELLMTSLTAIRPAGGGAYLTPMDAAKVCKACMQLQLPMPAGLPKTLAAALLRSPQAVSTLALSEAAMALASQRLSFGAAPAAVAVAEEVVQRLERKPQLSKMTTCVTRSDLRGALRKFAALIPMRTHKQLAVHRSLIAAIAQALEESALVALTAVALPRYLCLLQLNAPQLLELRAVQGGAENGRPRQGSDVRPGQLAALGGAKAASDILEVMRRDEVANVSRHRRLQGTTLERDVKRVLDGILRTAVGGDEQLRCLEEPSIGPLYTVDLLITSSPSRSSVL
eukprot:TRINITY_DN59457_c0_g1_i1.p1 TRINITY_DN59457_c0_g1~~TRINITY_DN59457_c0_g1_i1.p1  ORF type:complete len:471 (-),score=91.45 TRINITY_DN59457_c0_g1_i1:426-1838(-)